jgi:hypothetical protein
MGMSWKSMHAVAPRLGRTGAGLGLIVLLALLGSALAEAQPAWSKAPERSNSGEVQFTLTPRDVSGGRFRVDIVVTTHSGDLASLDLSAAAELRLAGRTLRPVKAPALRGHHTKGRLEFALDRMPESFEIVIRGVRTQGDLTFRWP